MCATDCPLHKHPVRQKWSALKPSKEGWSSSDLLVMRTPRRLMAKKTDRLLRAEQVLGDLHGICRCAFAEVV